MDHKIDFKELEFLMNKINMDIKREFLLKIFDKFDENKNKTLDFNEFKDMMDFINR